MDAEEANELTLQGLAQRLETQARRLEVLECENAELQHKVATLEDSGMRRDELAEKRGSDTPRDGESVTAEEFAGRVSRRSLLSKAGAAALGAVAAGTLLTTREAKANHRDPGINVDFIHVHAGNGRAVDAVSESGDAVVGISMKNGAGVVGSTHYPQSEGVDGWNLADGTGVRGTGGTGVDGRGKRFGVRGNSNEGIGVLGEGGQTGVVGFGKTYAGVVGRGAQFGGVFNAEKSGAQLLLIPGESRDRPTIGDHARGELYMDATGTLFVCTDGGNPGVWRVFQTGPA